MPYLARKEGSDDLVLPNQVTDRQKVVCPSCGSKMHLRDSYYNRGKYISQHFAHSRSGDNCEAESTTHLKMKGVAGQFFSNQFETADVVFEKSIAPGRIADLVVEFQTPLYRLGKGIAVEAQYRNKGKQLGDVSQEYLDNGWSVLWTYPNDFDFDELEYKFPEDRIIPQWPNAVEKRDPDELYPDILDVEDNDPTADSKDEYQVPATFPNMVEHIHGVDIVCPVRDGYFPAWKEHTRCGLQTDDAVKSWVTIYGHPDVGSFFELRQVDTKQDREEFIPVPVTPSVENDYIEFLKSVKTMLLELYEGERKRVEGRCCELELPYNAGLQGDLEFAITDDGYATLEVTQHDIVGCSRSLEIPFGLDEWEKLTETIQVLEHSFPVQRPFMK